MKVLDEVFVKINGKQHYLWQSIDQDGEVVGLLLQSRIQFTRLCTCPGGSQG